MSVLIETSVGDIVIDLYTKEAPATCLNFLKLCKVKYYNFCCFHNVQRDFMVQTGDPTATGQGGESIYGLLDKSVDSHKKYLPAEINPKLKHKEKGTVSMAIAGSSTGSTQEMNGVLGSSEGAGVIGSQFFITMADKLDYLDGRYTIFGKIAEGMDVLDKINEAYTDSKFRPFKDIRIKHTIVLDDPFPDPEGLQIPDVSPLPTQAMLDTVRIADDEELESGLAPEDEERIKRQKEAQARALTLEMVGDLPFAEIKPPENVLFVAQLNPATRSEDLELIFSRFGEILSCEVIRDKKTGDSLCYAFIEFENEEQCSEAYFKMNNVLIDDRRIHVDFSQSVSKLHKDWASKKAGKQRNEGGASDLNLEQRSRYRDSDGSGRQGQRYDYVFEEGRESHKSSKSRSERDKHATSSSERGSYRERNYDRRSESSRGDRSKESTRHRRSERSRSRSQSPRSRRRTDDRDRDREYDRQHNRDRYKSSSHR